MTSIRTMGLICGFFTIIQALIWIAGTIFGTTCFFGGTGSLFPSFKANYMDRNHASNGIVLPGVFLSFSLLYLVLSIIWLIACCNIIAVFCKWANFKRIKRAARFWIIITSIICFVDFVVFIIFLADLIKKQTGSHTYSPTGTTDTENDDTDYEEDDEGYIFNPFIKEKTKEKVPWPVKDEIEDMPGLNTKFSLIGNDTKLVLKVQDNLRRVNTNNKNNRTSGTINEAGTTIIPLKENVTLSKMPNSRFKGATNAEGQSGTGNVLIPAIICSVFALRGLIIWIANIVLVVHLRKKMKKLSIFSPIFKRCSKICGLFSK